MANNKKFISFENLKQFKTELDKKNLRVKANVEADLGETSLTFTAPNGENYKYEKFQWYKEESPLAVLWLDDPEEFAIIDAPAEYTQILPSITQLYSLNSNILEKLQNESLLNALLWVWNNQYFIPNVAGMAINALDFISYTNGQLEAKNIHFGLPISDNSAISYFFQLSIDEYIDGAIAAQGLPAEDKESFLEEAIQELIIDNTEQLTALTDAITFEAKQPAIELKNIKVGEDIYVIPESTLPTFKTINNQEITGEGNIELELPEIEEASELEIENLFKKEYKIYISSDDWIIKQADTTIWSNNTATIICNTIPSEITVINADYAWSDEEKILTLLDATDDVYVFMSAEV